MKWKITILLITMVWFVTACSLTSTTPGGSLTDQAPASSTSSPTEINETLSQKPTQTIAPSNTATPFSIQGTMTHNQLQDKVNAWVNEQIPFDDVDKLLSEVTAEELQFGLLEEPLFNDVIFYFYNLGYTLVEDEKGEVIIINVVGFEDALGARFSFPFHLGKLTNECRIVQLRLWEGRRIYRAMKLSYDELTPAELLQRSGELLNRVNTAVTWIDSRGRTGNQCVDEIDPYYVSATEITNALVAFFECADCEISNVSPVLSAWLNMVPEKFDPRLPYLRMYNVFY